MKMCCLAIPECKENHSDTCLYMRDICSRRSNRRTLTPIWRWPWRPHRSPSALSSCSTSTASMPLNLERVPRYFPSNRLFCIQCCGSGSRKSVLFWPLDPGIRDGKKKSRPGSRDKHPGSYFKRISCKFFGLKILKFFDADLRSCKPRIREPGSGME